MSEESLLALAPANDLEMYIPVAPGDQNIAPSPLPPGGRDYSEALYFPISPMGWLMIVIVTAVFTIGLFAVVRFLSKHYVATAGAVSLLLTIILFVVMNIAPSFFYNTILENPIDDIFPVMMSTAVPVLCVVGLALLFYGLYRLEKRIRTMV